ncbi:flavodoxin/nitric oxide synthase [Desulfobulbus propionicus DSM 2032]|jgi:flavorubredoxin|uniref:Flavodoxin/nitric oxide synthase n=1 Tax=Desulfobulbus propionicus (strain ATCC 33891 / DSM 2032 / VKM B-1956 / 1pr3) TaxID=577650 RepID=A0A7U3YM02_DESPD|nr:NAD(P)H-dependent oxidoreductase [Desulfobulbus propionicus]ADW17830.1 flavodoxin/nitric oxide synthase [Desulfobulbus propionicus DSM 2032]
MKTILVLYHSQGGTMDGMAHRFARGAAREEEVVVSLKRAQDATLDDLLRCDAIAIGSPEYFGTMAGMIKDFFDRTFQAAQDQTIGLPFVLFVCAGNDGRGAISQIERIVAGYKWRKALEHIRIAGRPTEADFLAIEELGHTLAAGVALGIF